MKNLTKKFLKRPEYPGGKAAFKEYIKKNLVYPAAALENEIEGKVHLIASIDDNGYVGGITVEKGIGYGCDEEAIRLVGNIRFGAVKNKGVRLKTRQRFLIEFRLPRKKETINYQIKKPSPGNNEVPGNKVDKKYSYVLNIHHNYQ